MQGDARKGTLAGLGCYLLWGLFPMYWKLLVQVDSLEIICHRIIWCTVLTLGACALLHRDFKALFRDKRAVAHLAPASVIITLNWGIYIVAVNTGHIVETAIGYYINPLVSILLGAVFFKERLSKVQLAATALCCIGVVYFTWQYGQFPWISIALAVSFGVYGAVKKHGGYDAVPALCVENLVMVVPALVCAVVLAFVSGSHGFLGDVATPEGWGVTLLLMGGGVATAVPLILFATAANSIPLSMLGFIQYLSPTIALLTGVFLFGEAFTLAHGVCLGCIWCGLAMVSAETVWKARS